MTNSIHFGTVIKQRSGYDDLRKSLKTSASGMQPGTARHRTVPRSDAGHHRHGTGTPPDSGGPAPH